MGYDGVVVAVPDWWTTGETQCGAPVEDTVYFDTGAVYDCSDPADPATVQEVSALAVLDAGRGYGEYLVRDMTKVGDVLERSGCEEWFEGVCRRVFALPDSDTAFAVTIAEEGDGDYEAIRDSVRELPDGVTTVPLATADGWTPSWGEEPQAVDALRAAIEEAGLRVEIEKVDRSGERRRRRPADGEPPRRAAFARQRGRGRQHGDDHRDVGDLRPVTC